MDRQEISRGEKMKNELLDAGTNELTAAGREFIHIIIQDVKEWIIGQYYNYRSKSSVNPEEELKKLEMQLSIQDQNVALGVEKEEIAVMWAMQKLGYSKAESQRVLNVANGTYALEDIPQIVEKEKQELKNILDELVESDLELISIPVKRWLDKEIDRTQLMLAIREADKMCERGDAMDLLYKRVLELL